MSKAHSYTAKFSYAHGWNMPTDAVDSVSNTNDTTWHPPHDDFLKINVDGAFIHGSSCAGISLIIRDAYCNLVDANCLVVNASSASMFEALALKRAVNLAIDYDFPKVIFE